MKSNYLLRSMFFVPGHVDKYLQKANSLNADAIILDLEDSVPITEKQKARDNVSEFLKAQPKDSKTLYVVRINELAENELLEDLMAVMHDSLFAVMPSKIYNKEDLMVIDRVIGQFESYRKIKQGSIKLIPLIETLDAFINVGNIAKSSVRMAALAFGGEDYLKELGGYHGENDHTFDYPRTKIAIAAKAAGIQAIDTPYLDVSNHKGFIYREQKSRDLGYDGCLLIHPSQVGFSHKCFSPSENEIKKANNIINAVIESEEKGLNVVLMDGVLVGPPMQKKAKLILDKQKLISIKNGK